MTDNYTFDCWYPDWYDVALNRVNALAYDIIPPVYLATTVIPSLFVALAFCMKYKKAKAIAYQRVYICQLAAYGLAATVYIYFLRRWAGMFLMKGPANVVGWFRSSYVLMWYTCNLVGPQLNVMGLVSMMLLVWMAVDRMLALGAPIFYKKLNHRKFAISLIVISYLLAVAVNISDIPRLYMILDGNIYSCKDDWDYAAKSFALALSTLRNIVNFLVVACIVIFNTVTIILFFRHRKSAVLAFGTWVDAREQENKRISRALVIMTVSQSAILMLGQPFVIATYVMSYVSPDIFACHGIFIVVFLEMFAQFLHILQFFGLFAFNRQYSDLLTKSPFIKWFSDKMSVT